SQPTSGSIYFEDKNINTLKEKQLANFRNKQIGFVFQFHHLLPEFTALENVCIPAFIGGTPRKEAEDNAKEILGFLNLSGRLEHKPNELSGGEQQRVAVARALINQPAVILADEPSGNLDTKTKEELHDLFFSLRDKYNPSIVIVTHDNSLADKADRKLTLTDGVFV
ncbi:MAG: ABC transporter ATP-binding protein, partial [Bacteroidota bacterium]